MNKTHNKKRNIGIIFEQLVQAMSESIVASDVKRGNTILSLIRRHFRPGTELYKEFRLFNSLVRTRVENPVIANRIIMESKKASTKFDKQELRKQKSLLIKEINHLINESNFYNRRVSNYRDYATIQTLLNDWRAGSKDIGRIAEYEDGVCKRLLSESPVVPDHAMNDTTERDISGRIDTLTVRLMTEKFNKKYYSTLNSEQTRIIREYALNEGSHSSLGKVFNSIKSDTLQEIDQFMRKTSNSILNEKVNDVKSKILAVDIKNITDATVTKLLTISRLKQTLLEEE